MEPTGILSGAMSPGITNSSPVENKATRGARVTCNCANPTLAAIPRDAGVSRSPFCKTLAPRVTSSPERRIHWPKATADFTRTWLSSSGSQSSCITTASAPSGIGAPVKMRAASPACNVVPWEPAGIRCVTFKTALVFTQSAKRNA